MGKQFNYYADFGLSSKIREMALSLGLGIIKQDSQSKQITRAHSADDFASEYNLFFYDELLGALSFNKNTGLINDGSSPVIQVLQTIVNHEEECVSCGRLWVATSHYNVADKKIVTAPELIRKYTKLVTFIKRNVVNEEVPHGEYRDVYIRSYVSVSLLSDERIKRYRFM